MPGCNFEGYVFPAQILEHHGFISENKNDKSKCVRLCKYSSPEAQKILGESFSATQKRVRDKIQHEQARIDADNASIITHYAEAGLSMEEIKRTPGLLRRADSTISSAQSAEADLAEDEPVEDEPAEATSSSINAMTKNYRNAIQTELDELWTMALVSGGIQGHFLANTHFQKAVARTAAVVFFFSPCALSPTRLGPVVDHSAMARDDRSCNRDITSPTSYPPVTSTARHCWTKSIRRSSRRRTTRMIMRKSEASAALSQAMVGSPNRSGQWSIFCGTTYTVLGSRTASIRRNDPKERRRVSGCSSRSVRYRISAVSVCSLGQDCLPPVPFAIHLMLLCHADHRQRGRHRPGRARFRGRLQELPQASQAEVPGHRRFCMQYPLPPSHHQGKPQNLNPQRYTLSSADNSCKHLNLQS